MDTKKYENPDVETLEESTDDDKALYEHFVFDVDAGQSLLRIDKYLMMKIENATRNKIQQSIKAGNVLVNKVVVKANYKVKPHDHITIVMAYPPRDTTVKAENIPLDVIYEDDDVIIINKASGMVVHPGHGNFTGTLLHALKYHFEQQNKGAEAFLVHRIDKDTTGLMMVAKNELAQARLAQQFYVHSIERTYQALVWGDMKEETGTITGHIGRHPRNRMQMTVFEDGEQGKHAVTHYKMLRSYGYVSLVECRLETGRTHQIRAHFTYLKHPLFNDARYGGDKILKGTTFSKYRQFVDNCFALLPRQALHAKSLGFVHPTTGKEMYFDSELPQDMQSVLQKWEVYSNRSVSNG